MVITSSRYRSISLWNKAIKRQIVHSMVEISKAKFLSRPVGNLELMEVDISVKVTGSEQCIRNASGIETSQRCK